jgi:hypothetical protein
MAVWRTAAPRSVPPDAGGRPAFGHLGTRGILAGASSAGNTMRDCASGNLLTKGYLRGFRTIQVLLALRELRELK